MYRIASSITTRCTLWVAEGQTIGLPAYEHAGNNSKYKGHVGSKNRYWNNSEAKNISFFA
tara:strand:+ start:221 stop:400 length:180 start_codon:yes stop_codon:yes gene_type:complete